MRLTTEKQIPANIRTYAHKHNLGTPRILYETHKSSRLFLFLGPFAIAIGCLIVGTYLALYEGVFSWWPMWKALLVPGVGAAWLFIGLWILLAPWFSPHFRLFLCPKGLIYQQGSCEVIAWDQISQVVKDIDVDKHKNIGVVYRILRNDGRWFNLRSNLPHIERLYGFVEREVARQLLPGVIFAFDGGEIQKFADLAVSHEGVSIKQGIRNLPWSQFERVALNENTLSIYRRDDSWEWATMSVSGIPNVHVLQGLLEHAAQKRSAIPVTEPIVRMLPAIISVYESGVEAHFGDISISKTGVRISGQSVMIPWSEIASFGLGESDVIIKRTGNSKQWYTVPFWSIRDEDAFKELVDYILFKALA